MEKIKKYFSVLILTILLVITMTGCGTIDDDSTDNKTDENVETLTGNFSLGIIDAPIDEANKVVIQFHGLEIQAASGELLSFDFETPRQINLLALTDGNSEYLLNNEDLPAGHYEWIRLMVDAEAEELDSYIELEDGSKHSLKIPSANQTGLKIVRGFEIPLGGIADFTIDFDLRKSVHTAAGGNNDYLLRPTLRLIDNSETGAIKGNLDSLLIDDPNDPGCHIYIFEGEDVVPDDLDENEAEPITITQVRRNIEGEFCYHAAFIKAGNYTIALTYQAQYDDPRLDDLILFEQTAQVTVSAGSVAQYDFEYSD